MGADTEEKVRFREFRTWIIQMDINEDEVVDERELEIWINQIFKCG